MGKETWARHPLITGAQKTMDVVVRTATLEEIGLTRDTIYQRCRPGRPWRKLLSGVIQLSRDKPTPDIRMRAALLRAGPDAMVTGLWALRLYGLRHCPEPSDVHVLVPDGCQVSTTEFLLVERTTRLPKPLQRNKIPVAPVQRAVLDAARRLTDQDTIQAMLADVIQRGKCSPEEIGRELGQGSQRGSALPRLALLDLMAGAHSVAEADAQRLWERAGLPECQRNVKIFDGEGNYIATPDSWVDAVAFAWEIDSKAHHADDGFEGTVARNARYAAAGVVVLQTTPRRLRAEPEKVLAELKACYAAACRRPRPDVRVG
ncbi:hypothetical protein [Amycolatopsis sp. NPDC059657]|uniref:hypothetical protein n=1 Tax=Amycolatopsis sp. NPDC059657 TaxID=3346899 RepID=UPI003671B1B9